MALFHRDAFGLPNLKIGTLNGVVLGWHAQDQARKKGIDLTMKDLSVFIPADWTLIEIEVLNGIPVKIVARQSFDNDNDLVIVILRKEKLVKTVWVNAKTDTHLTLDKTPYSRP